MMHTKRIFLSKRRNRLLAEYFSFVCGKSRAMKNTANFYIRNTMSGLLKSPEDRTHNETEVMHFVFTGIQKANRKKDAAFAKGLEKLKADGVTGIKLHVAVRALLKKERHFEYPTYEKWFLSYNVLDAVFKETGNDAYVSMPSQVNQNAIRAVMESWKSYFKSLKAYGKDTSRFRAKPRPPRYIKDWESTAVFTNQTARIKDAGKKTLLFFVNNSEPLVVGNITGKYVRTLVKPCPGGYTVLITTDDGIDPIDVPKDAKRFFGIDIGVDNLAAVVNNVGLAPFLIKGTAVKAVNRWFNKRRAELVSAMTRGKDSSGSHKDSRALDALSGKRADFLRDIFYKTAHYICRMARLCHVQVIIAGHNDGQKDEIGIGHVNNQNFVSIPFTQFLSILKYTSWEYKIAFIQREESYTSKASLLDLDDIPTYRKGDDMPHVFSGKRVKRGLYRSKNGILLNADVNGAGNIIRKQYPNAFDNMDFSYLYKTTRVVGFKNLYAPGVPADVMAKHMASKPRMHRPGPSSSANRARRWDKKVRLMEAFGVGKKPFIPQSAQKQSA